MEVSGHLHSASVLIPGKDPSTCAVGGWVGFRVDRDAVLMFDKYRLSEKCMSCVGYVVRLREMRNSYSF